MQSYGTSPGRNTANAMSAPKPMAPTSQGIIRRRMEKPQQFHRFNLVPKGK